MDLESDLDALDAQLDDLGGSLTATGAATAAFQKELGGMQEAIRAAGADAKGLGRTLSGGLRAAMGDLVIDGAKLSDALTGLARRVADTTFNKAITPVTDAVGGALGGLISKALGGFTPFADGAAFSSGAVRAFAEGGVVDAPTHFPMRGGLGLMGEAGPEAIMPLARGADGKLGVRGGGGTVVHVQMNVTTPDVAGFQRSRGQVAAGLARAIQRGGRNL